MGDEAMGQGTESCGGYDVVYDEYDHDNLCDGYWTMRDGTRIHVSKMELSHLKNTRRMVANLARTSTFTSEQEKWESWLEVFDDEIRNRHYSVVAKKPKANDVNTTSSKPRGKMVTMVCYCGKEYQAREADLKRGWGLTCCKSHAAIRRDFGRPAAKRK